MNCLFCKNSSDSSKSVEHIIPESLGNKDHTLPPGFVCDDCNNYFSIKVEKPFLELPYFKSLRHRNGVWNKKGKPVVEEGIIPHPDGGTVNTFVNNGNLIIDTEDERILNLILSGKVNKVITPFHFIDSVSEKKVISRFVCKVAVEAMLHKLLHVEGWVEEVMNKNELEWIKQYARYGKGVDFWPYSQRELYKESQCFQQPDNEEKYQVIHEYDFFWTKEMEFYFVMAIFGMEYAVNLANPSIATYNNWLSENNNRSILEDEREKRIRLDMGYF